MSVSSSGIQGRVAMDKSILLIKHQKVAEKGLNKALGPENLRFESDLNP